VGGGRGLRGFHKKKKRGPGSYGKKKSTSEPRSAGGKNTNPLSLGRGKEKGDDCGRPCGGGKKKKAAPRSGLAEKKRKKECGGATPRPESGGKEREKKKKTQAATEVPPR